MINPYYLFMAEQEGLLPTRAGCLNAALTEVKDAYNRLGRKLTMDEFTAILQNNNILNIKSKEFPYFVPYVDFL